MMEAKEIEEEWEAAQKNISNAVMKKALKDGVAKNYFYHFVGETTLAKVDEDDESYEI